jgi:tetratricopeptide (TPR) repeat protein
MIRRFAIVALLAGASRLEAQDNTDEVLRQSVTLYENLEVERALALLRRVVSPSSPFEVSREQRVTAYKYLGAALAILGQADSSIVYFRAALERDPFLDLDPDRFTQQEQAALAEARRRSFGTASRPLLAKRWDPAHEEVTFSVVTTHQAALRVEIQPVDGTDGQLIYDRETNGIREIGWNGVINSRIAPPGMYELRLVGRSLLTGRVDSASVPFAIRHDFPPLDDTLPSMLPQDLLPERYSSSAGRSALLKGLAVATAALLVPRLAGHGDLRDGGNALAATAATAAAGAGVAAFVVRRRSPAIPANIARNNARRAERAAVNAEIVRRNAERIAQTRLVLVPGTPR